MGKKERERTLSGPNNAARVGRWCENARERAERTRTSERGKRSFPSERYRVRFSVVFRRSFLMHPLSLYHRRRRAHRSPSLPIAPSENCHAARARALGFIDTFNICSRSLCYSSPDVNNNRASHP